MLRAILMITIVFTLAILLLESGDIEKERSVKMQTYKHTNKLINEPSPYLLQHAHNPVDWFPWGDEAFDKARKKDKPIFLSIGYSTCHWCHVMERESFENEKIAEILNEHFISIKVDREQRPDVDAVYMNVVQMMTGSGGWPLSVFLTPDGKAFYGGTYFPPKDMYGRPGFDTILKAVIEGWQNKRPELLKTAGQVSNALKQINVRQGEREIKLDVLDNGFKSLQAIFDPVHGGFGSAPKFPQPTNLLFLLSYHHRTKNTKALEMVEKTLSEMADGGMYDHLGGGFARYSTDQYWLVPHFEKMLYDQALLAMIYVSAYQVTGNQKYAQVAKEIFDYVLRGLTDEKGGFHSAEDADSEGVEGKFYVWTKMEIEKALGKEKAKIFNSYYNVTKDGNFEHNTNILNVKDSIESVAKKFGKSPTEIQNILTQGRDKLFGIRAKRIRPHLDDKVITASNGLMIASLSYSGAVLDDQKYTNAAEKAAQFVLSDLIKDDRLQRFYCKGKSVGNGYLDDYSFMILGLLELYEATYDTKYLENANRLANQMIELFGNGTEGGFYQTASDSEKLIVRSMLAYDGAVPSGNSVAAYVLLKLGRLTMNDKLTEQGSKTVKRFSGQIEQSPLSSMFMLLTADLYLGPTQEIVIAGDIQHINTKAMLQELSKRYLPRALTIFHSSKADRQNIQKLIPFIAQQTAIDGKATAYICENYACRQPVTNFKEFISLLEK